MVQSATQASFKSTCVSPFSTDFIHGADSSDKLSDLTTTQGYITGATKENFKLKRFPT